MIRLGITLALAAGAGGLARAQGVDWDLGSDTWAATDGLGRSVAMAGECGTPRVGKFVGIFYFLWLEGKGPVHDISKLTAANPAQPAYGPVHAFHFWGEPLFGYYRSDDEFVIRKHAQMLADAGVDVLFLDVTNGLTYQPTCLTVCRVLDELRKLGQRTPQIAFLANSQHVRTVSTLHREFYAKQLYPDLWFRWQGKPLLLAPGDGLPPAIAGFFTLRHSWAWTQPKGWFGTGQDKWPWLDHTPQNFGWHKSPAVPEQVPVAVAEHPIANIGRSFHNGQQPPPGQTRTAEGLYFAEQSQRALQVDPELVFVTGWNEWIAQRFINERNISLIGRKLAAGETFFVDAYNQEFSRDLEPMRGGHGDNYYYQLVDFIRRFKGARPLPPVTGGPVTVDGRFEDWQGVTPEFRDTLGDPARRNHPGWKGQPPFVNQTGRNDLQAAKVAADATHVYFHVRTRDPLTPAGEPAWMLLFIDADRNPRTGWFGYDFVVNRVRVRPNITTLERNEGGAYRWGAPVEVACRSAGSELELAIPRAALGLHATQATLDFKWADNLRQTGCADDFSLHGDAAPNDRFNYRAVLGPVAQEAKP